MPNNEWILPKGLVPIHRSSNCTSKATTHTTGVKSDDVKHKHKLPSQYFPSMSLPRREQYSRNTMDTIEPVPWPLPPRRNSDGMSQLNPSENDFHAQPSDGNFLTPRTSFANAEINDKTSQQIFQRISELYPPCIDNPPCEESNTNVPSLKVDTEKLFKLPKTPISLRAVNRLNTSQEKLGTHLSRMNTSSDSVVDFLQTFSEDEEAAQGFGQSSEEERNETEHEEEEITRIIGDDCNLKAGLRALFAEDDTALSPSTEQFVSQSPAPPEKPSNQPSDWRSSVTEQFFQSPKSEGSSMKEEHKNSSGAAQVCEPVVESTDEDTLKQKCDEVESPEPKAVLRRPIASRRKTWVNIPPVGQSPSVGKDNTAATHDSRVGKECEKLNSNITNKTHNVKNVAPISSKGVIMRAQGQLSYVSGVRKAEMGKIMGRHELRGRRGIPIQECPDPKSLKPAMFFVDDEETPPGTSSMALDMSSSDAGSDAPKASVAGSRRTLASDDGSFLAKGVMERHVKSGALKDESTTESFYLSETSDSTGLVNRVGCRLKKATTSLTGRTGAEIGEYEQTDIVLPGTIDEAVCKICVISRRSLNCDVVVKDNGRKIKIKSRDDVHGPYIRVSLILRRKSEENVCSIKVRQSRSDGMKTTVAALWGFYQRLEHELLEMG